MRQRELSRLKPTTTCASGLSLDPNLNKSAGKDMARAVGNVNVGDLVTKEPFFSEVVMVRRMARFWGFVFLKSFCLKRQTLRNLQIQEHVLEGGAVGPGEAAERSAGAEW